MVCGPREAIHGALESRFGEARVMEGYAPGVVYEVWVNPETRSWTFTRTTPAGSTCVWASGEGFEVIPAPPKGQSH